MRKRFLALGIVLLMVLSLAACSKDEKKDSADSSSKTEKSEDKKDSSKTDSKENTAAGSDVKTDGNVSAGDDSLSGDASSADRPERNAGMNRASMESKIAAYLSEIGGPDEISICDGASFVYEPWNEWSLWGDQWTIKQPDVASGKEVVESIEKQLVEGCGFKKSIDLWGTDFYVSAGVKQLGIKVMYTFDSEEPQYNEVTIAMTHSPECYTMAYIEEMKALMPKVNPFLDVREKLPANHQIRFMQGTYEKVIIAKDGDYYTSEIDRDPDGWNTTGYTSVYKANGDGTYVVYEGSGFMSESLSRSNEYSTEDVERHLQTYYDPEGFAEKGSLSTWGQISTEYLEGESSFLDDSCKYFSFSTSLSVTEPEEIAGVMCDTCADDNLWTKTAFAYEPETGVTFRIIRTESGSEPETYFEVLEYNMEPETLGTFTE